MLKREKLIWFLFFIFLILIFLNVINAVPGLHLGIERSRLYRLLFFGLPVALLVCHSITTLSFSKATFLILLSSFVGWVMEVWGLRSGTFFGGHYVYNMGDRVFWDIPFLVIFYWAVFIYTGYSITNSFLSWLGKKKPNKKNRNLSLLPIAVLLDSLFVVFIDLFMDPIQVAKGDWTWLDRGPYFGVPIGNFIGWFVVALIVSGIFRTSEYFSEDKDIKFNESIYLIPVIGYGLLVLYFFQAAIKFGMWQLAIIGSALMLPVVLINIVLFSRSKK